MKVNLTSLWAQIKYEELSGKPFSSLGDNPSSTDLTMYAYSGYYAHQRIEKEPYMSFDEFVDEVQESGKLMELLTSKENPKSAPKA